MHLFDPTRPSLNSRPTFLSGVVVVPPLSVWPLPNGNVRVSAMLPLQGEGPFTSTWFEREIPPEELESLLTNFRLNPEETLETFFSQDARRPNLRDRPRTPAPPPPASLKAQVASLFNELSEL